MNEPLYNIVTVAPVESVPTAVTSTVAFGNVFRKPCKLLQAVGEPARWQILKELLDGKALSILELARRVGRKPSQMSKHLKVLREAGVLVQLPSADGDGRKAVHALPPECLRMEAGKPVLDYGVCVLRFG